ncbi:MAG: RsmD family RNA methyltransferase [Verrucomicrobia bacterium]|nr:RsmD family RNA methyltransferase [Verrucomicrobiota bacterium]
MRISGGDARGIPLEVPKGDRVRPATDGMRQAVFSSLAAFVPGATFLDLFAGSGAYGLEALSRGAAGGVFVERDPKALACLRRNVASVSRSLGTARITAGAVEIRPGDACQPGLTGTGQVPDLVFVDPPYELIEEVAPLLFARLADLLAPKPEAIVAFEYPGEITLNPPGWVLVKRIGKGARQPTVGFFRPVPRAEN